MADMKVSVRLGREAGDNLLDAPGVEIGLDDVADEVAAGLAGSRIAQCLIVLRHASSTVKSDSMMRAVARASGGLCHDVPLGSMSIALTPFPATCLLYTSPSPRD